VNTRGRHAALNCLAGSKHSLSEYFQGQRRLIHRAGNLTEARNPVCQKLVGIVYIPRKYLQECQTEIALPERRQISPLQGQNTTTIQCLHSVGQELRVFLSARRNGREELRISFQILLDHCENLPLSCACTEHLYSGPGKVATRRVIRALGFWSIMILKSRLPG
jgi:hypothetical protein